MSKKTPGGPVVGIDYGATRVSFFVLFSDGRAPIVGAPHFKDPSLTPRVYRDMHALTAYLSTTIHATDVHIESPIVGGNANYQTAVKMAASFGALMSGMEGSDVRVETPAPSQWKKTVVGHGHTTKHGVAQWLHENHPNLFQHCYKYVSKEQRVDYDLTDAACLALSARLSATQALAR
jgi:Holliday junction resolvasome RuvABC endonuclease subunit